MIEIQPSDAYLAGRTACAKGAPLSANPETGRRRRRLWAAGWNMRFQEVLGLLHDPDGASCSACGHQKRAHTWMGTPECDACMCRGFRP